MKRHHLLIWITLLIFNAQSIAQTSLQGKVTEADTGEPVLFGTVALYKNNVPITGVETDLYGNYFFKNIDPGTYDVEASYVGLTKERIVGVIIVAGKVNQLDIQLSSGGITLDEVVIVDYKIPLIQKDNTSCGAIVRREQIVNVPTKNINGLSAKIAGVGYSNDGGNNSMRDSRTSLTYSYISGNSRRGNTIFRKKSAKKKQRKLVREQTYYQQKETNDYNREGYDAIVENPFLEAHKNPLSTFSIDVDAAAYSNMRRFINRRQMPPKDAVRIEEMINYFDYDYPAPKEAKPFEVITELSDCPWAGEHQLLHIGLQGKKTSLDNLPPSNIVFLLDVSGSMDTQNKLPLLKSSLKLLTNNLRKQDKVSIVVYAGSSGLVLPATAGNDKKTILAALEKLKAGGSTAGGEGIKLAYKIAQENFIEGGNNRIILATDGDFNVGLSSDSDLVKLIEEKRKSKVFLTVLGFGMGNYQDAKMQKLADSGNGNHAYIDHINEAQKVLVNEFGGTLFTIAKDVKLQLEFNPQKVKAYRLIGYENRMLAAEDFNDDKKDAGELGAGHTVTALYEIIPADVDSDLVRSVDPLKYQKTKFKLVASFTEELLTVKLRYKLPEGDISKLIQEAVLEHATPLANTSDNFRFSASVASFGMQLRDSEYKGNATYEDCIKMAQNALGKDTFGYRKECIGLMEVAKQVDVKDVAEK